jgi:hypothetical protein
MRVGISDNLLIGIVTGIPVNKCAAKSMNQNKLTILLLFLKESNAWQLI